MSNKIPLATSDGVIEIAGIYYMASRAFGDSLHNMVDSIAKMNGHADWFEKLQAAWEAKNIKAWEDPHDPRLLLNEISFKHSAIRKLLPNIDYEWDKQAHKLVDQLNKWSHQGIDPKIPKLLDILYPMRFIAAMTYLDVENEIADSIQRLKEIRDGLFVTSETPTQVSPEATAFAKKVEEKVEEIKKRPPVGHLWIGSKGNRKVFLNLNKREVVEDSKSIRSELGENPDEKIDAWLRMLPKGGELFIDEPDGAVMAYKHGDPYLVGWLGEEPKQKQDEIRGFFLDGEFIFEGNDIRDVDTEELLSEVADEPIDTLIQALNTWGLPVGSVLNVTIYGELIFDTPTGETRNITQVHKGIWFPGQLDGEL
jgi:hypothetical protein